MIRNIILTAILVLVCAIPLMAVQTEHAVQATQGELSPDGHPAIVDLPQELRKKNIASAGLGCCVFRSIDHAAHWQNMPQLNGFPEWMVQNRIPGGGYPTKVDRLIPQICEDRGQPVPNYIQVENNDLDILKLACKTRRMVCITYSYSPSGRYSGQRIAHMVNLVHADDRWFAVLDNNYIEQLEWMTPEEFLPVYHGGRTGWAIIFLDYPPPPIPTN